MDQVKFVEDFLKDSLLEQGLDIDECHNSITNSQVPSGLLFMFALKVTKIVFSYRVKDNANTAQKMFSIKNFFSKCEEIRRSHLLKR